MAETLHTGEAVARYSAQTLEQWLLAQPPALRQKLVEDNTGTTLNYVQKRMWTRDYAVSPTFKLKIAVGLDKASQGRCDFRDMLDDSDQIDWHYIAYVLNRRLKAEAAGGKVAPAIDP